MRDGVAFVGGVPGAPGLICVRGAELLARARVVLADEGLEGHAAMAPEAAWPAGPWGPDAVLEEAERGGLVVRLLAWDPAVFAGVEQSTRRLASEGLAWEIVPCPGVAEVVSAYAGLPFVTTREHGPSMAFARLGVVEAGGLRGDDPVHGWEKLSCATDVLVVETTPGHVGAVIAQLLNNGRDPGAPAFAVVDLASPRQRVVAGTLADIATRCRGLLSPSTIGSPSGRLYLVTGEGLDDRQAFRWFDKLPLFGRRVLVTRAREQADETLALLRERGAEPIAVPIITIRPPTDAEPLRAAVAALPGGFEWVAFTSVNGVERTFDEIARQGGDARRLGGARVAAIGPGTARALEARGVRPDVVAKEFKGEGLADALREAERSARAATAAPTTPATATLTPTPPTASQPRVLIARAKEAREVLPEMLRELGWAVTVVAAYETHAPEPARVRELAARFEIAGVDAVLFTSSSTVDNLVAALGARATELLARCRLASIGPITTATLERHGLRAHVTASEYTVPGLVAALERFYAGVN